MPAHGRAHQGAVRLMASDAARPDGSGRFLLAADAFVFAAALDILVSSVFIVLNVLTGFANTDMTEAGAAARTLQVAFLLVTIAVIGLGAAFAWRAHGRTVSRSVVLGMVAGAIVGTPLAVAVFGFAAMLLSRVPLGSRDDPPWLALGLLVAVVIAFLAAPVVHAIRDLSGPKLDARLDWLRLGALGIVVAIAGVALPVIGAAGDGEIAEAGIFMVPFAAAAVFAVLGADLAERLKGRKTKSPEAAPQG